MKEDIEYLEPMWPMRHFLISSGDIEKSKNIISVSFCVPVSKDPPLIAMAIMKKSYSYELISQSKEFIVNIPAEKLKSEIYYCGFHSGREVDKFKETGLTAAKAKQLSAPVIEECIAHLECRYIEEIETGDKILIIGRVVETYGDKTLLSEMSLNDLAAGNFPGKIYGGRFK